MMVISVASGKGGTGKTTVAVSLALSAEGSQYLDCDVEEPDGQIFLKPKITERFPVRIPVPRMDESKCKFCGRCAESCAFNAIVVAKLARKTLVFPELCHGCGVCSYVCPVECIEEVPREIGVVEKGWAGEVAFVQGILKVGEPMPTPLVREVKKQVDSGRLAVVDASPGTSCPVVEAVRGTDFCILVTEPTPFGLNDLKLAVEMTEELGVPVGVVINRADLGDGRVEEFCEAKGIPVLMRIPFRREIAEAYSEGLPLVEAFPEYREMFAELIGRIGEVG